MLTSTPIRLKPFLKLDKLADEEHEIWSHWMKYLFSVGKFNEDGTWTMPKWAVDRWLRQMNAKYADLTDKEKRSDQEVVLEHHKHLINDEEICVRCYKDIKDKVKAGDSGSGPFCYDCYKDEVESPPQLSIEWNEGCKPHFTCAHCGGPLGGHIYEKDSKYFCSEVCRALYREKHEEVEEVKITVTCNEP